ncbi:hypothetical protein tpqmel_0563 [Candidatus Gastranaerophilus sp. (ex Termes propinquus)]|nr:hypothetical protein tpqmel_0563 [Candidatus Gastranaerophilus sp. (ex Termes propinquus)]
MTLPKKMSFSSAQKFAHSQLEWIKLNAKHSAECSRADETEHLRAQAKEYLPKKLQQLADMHGFKYKKVTIKNMRSRWGSCSYFNNINLNLNLMRLDEDLIKYVLLHELVHTVEKNHSAKFWALLQKHLPEALELRKKLKSRTIS